MKFLVLHNNYPAQFKFILPALIQQGHDVIFLSLEYHGNIIKGVKHFKLKPIDNSNAPRFEHPYLGMSKYIGNAEIFRAAFDRLKNEGFYPDFVLFHSGWGIGHFVKSIFPKCISAAYAEWWYSWDSEEEKFDRNSPYSPVHSLSSKVSFSYLNSLQATSLIEADFIWTPTKWQREQFPKSFHEKINVIHEGVDLNFFKRSDLHAPASQQLNITYTSRALEPMRCFHHFIEVLSRVMNCNSHVNLTIVGKDKPVYRPLPTNSQSLGQIGKKKFSDMGFESRINWIDRLETVEYKNLLIGSDVHVYFSRPFVASWSLLEAMSSGCSIVSNSSKMAEEFLENDSFPAPAALMTQCENYDRASEDILNFLESHECRTKCSINARKIAQNFNYQNQVSRLFEYIGLI